MTLEQFFTEIPKAAVAFSGGTDSAFLLWAAKKYGCEIRAYYVNTVFQPAFELEDAVRMTEELQVPMTVISTDILSVPEVSENGPGRCYYCKRGMFTALWKKAREDGYQILLDGTNASDDADDRPGIKALKELEVRSPLRECGVTKAEVRSMSREAGLFTWRKPAYACLATRVPTGTRIWEEALGKVECAENCLAGLGFEDFRVRILEGNARIQVTKKQMPLVMEKRDEILEHLKPLFTEVFLDLNARQESQ